MLQYGPLVPEMTTYHLQGVPLDSYIDRFYVLQSTTELLGFMQNKMVWVKQRSRWEIVSAVTDDTEAFTEEKDFPLGSNLWFFTSENRSVNLNFHVKVEQPGRFCCSDGVCVSSDWRCDGDRDCTDADDEEDCKMIIPVPNYNKRIPPRTVYIEYQLSRVHINVDMTIFNIIDIDETESNIKLDFGLELKWKDKYLTYKFLNSNPVRNVVRKEMEDIIWTPQLHFLSLMNNEDDPRTARNFFVERQGKAIMSNDSDEIYEGKENWLTIETINQASFICLFDNIQFYPFGTQTCSFKLFIPGIDNNFTRLIAGTFVNNGPKSVGDYEVREWSVKAGSVIAENHQHLHQYEYSKMQNNIGVVYTVHLSRKIGNILMVTYLPTLLMNLINQATNYISSPDKYELIITVNITCMMVLASIYLAVSTSLPTTAEIKPVEIWLLFSLVYPGLVIVINIIIQVKK